jgi:hypothetical protein
MEIVEIDRGTSGDAQVVHVAPNKIIPDVKTLQAPGEDQYALNDPRFITNLKFLMIMQQVIVSQGDRLAILGDDKDQIYLGRLSMLYLAPAWDRWRKTNCRTPSLDEWSEVERKIITLEQHLTSTLLRRVSIKHLSGKILEKVAFGSLFVSVGALIAALLLDNQPAWLLLGCFTIWSVATGVLGSTAFLYVNALSIQVDPTVDLTSRTLVVMRLILGALFAVILTVPFGYDSFHNFSHNFLMPSQGVEPNGTGIKDSLLLLFPFTLGFSTPLALSILGRLIQSVRAFFGLGEQSNGSKSDGNK